jgi:ectoine hydroxylase-related dioxygenase (phytanoyl-CoA dioxygenase family)
MDIGTVTQSIASDGYAVLRQVIPRSVARSLGEIAEERWRRRPNATEHFLHEFDFLNREPRLRMLVQIRSILNVVTEALGCNIHVYHCHLTVTGGCAGADGQLLAPPYEWHQDGGALVRDLGGPTAPRLSVKAGFLLSDVPTSDHGPTVMVPGSHRVFSQTRSARDSLWPGAIAITGQAGDCVVFDNRIWHSRSPNLTDRPRVLASIAYAPRWVRSRDRLTSPDLTGIESTSALAQLLGFVSDARSCHVDGADTELPLRRYLDQVDHGMVAEGVQVHP